MSKPKHLIHAQDIPKEGYDWILKQAKEFIDQGIPKNIMEGKVAATLFFQPSTRTMTSVQSAMIRSGGGWVGVTGEAATSMEKGEDLADTVRTYGGYADIIFLRHKQNDATEVGAAVSRVPVINGGNGDREHAIAGGLLLFNIYNFLGRLDKLKIGVYGTPETSRAAKAALTVLGYYGAEVYVDDLGYFAFPDDVVKDAKKNGLGKLEYGKLDDFIGEVDWLLIPNAHATADMPKEKKDSIHKHYKPINNKHMKKLRKDAFLDMITPVVFEIDREVDSDPRAIYMKKETHTEFMLAAIMYFLDMDK